MRNAIVLLATTLALAVSAHAQWKVSGHAAVVENKEGYSLSIARQAHGWVWATLALPERSNDTLAAGQAPAFRVDGQAMHDATGAMKMQAIGIEAYASAPKRVSFVIWQARDDGVRNDKIDQLMSGKDVVFRYTAATGVAKETSFPLGGAGQALARALDLTRKPDRALVEDDQTFRWAYGEVMKRCSRAGADAANCSRRAVSCGKKAGSHDLAVFQACVK